MSNLYERPIPLIPSPQQLKLAHGQWKPRAAWKFFPCARGKSWAFAANERHASRLLERVSCLKVKQSESYALTTFAEGAVATAHDDASLLRARATMSQLLRLTKDKSLPHVEIQDW